PPPNVDRTKCDEAGKQVVTADTNLDKKPDVWGFYAPKKVNGQTVQVLTCKIIDLNHDGKVDMITAYDAAGLPERDEIDGDFDGKFDIVTYYQSGKKVRTEVDTNFDQKPDVWKYYEDEKLVRIEKDRDGNG